MQTASDSNPVLLGLRIYEVLTLIGIIIGPIVAVVITLMAERLRRRRDSRMAVLRALLSTFRTPGDANYSVAMNMLMIEFQDHRKVMEARREYMNIVRFRAVTGDEEAHQEQIVTKQIALLYQVSKAMGFKITEGDIKSEAYFADGWIGRESLYLDSLLATREIADALKDQLALLKAGVQQQPPPDGTKS